VKHLSGALLHGRLIILTHEHYNKLERRSRDEQSSLFVNYVRKKFHNTGPLSQRYAFSQKIANVNAPLDPVFRQWRQNDNNPKFVQSLIKLALHIYR